MVSPFTFSFDGLTDTYVPNNNIPTCPGEWHFGDFYSNCFKLMYPPGTPFTLYFRLIPRHGESSMTLPSNVVVLHYNTPPLPPPGQGPLAPETPSIYDVKILPETYVPPTFNTDPGHWGCVVVDQDTWVPNIESSDTFSLSIPNINDPDCTDISKSTCTNMEGNPIAKTLLYSKDQVLCPGPRDTGCGSWDVGCLLGGIINMIGDGWDWLGQKMAEAVGWLTTQVASVIPGCGDSDTCKGIISAGIKAGFTALTGLPASLPSSDQLLEKGIAYATGEIANELTVGGFSCEDVPGDACKAAIKAGLQQAITEARNMASQSACVDEQEAHSHDKEPLCLPGWVPIHPLPGTTDQPGVVIVRVTRKPGTESVDAQTALQYELDLAAIGENQARLNTCCERCKFTEDVPARPQAGCGNLVEKLNYYSDWWSGDNNQPLYQLARQKIPVLQPGESVDIPIGLKPVPGNFGFGDEYVCDNYTRFKYLFYKGVSHMTAREVCPSAGMADLVACGGTDTYDVDNPVAP